MSFTADEETDSLLGTGWLVRNVPLWADVAIVMEGEIDMLLDDTQVRVKAGDVLVQQGTNHAWVNNSGKVCRVAFVLIDANAPAAWRRNWKP